MNKLIAAVAMTVLLTACGTGEVNTTEQATTAPVEVEAEKVEPMVFAKKEPVLVEVLDKKLIAGDFESFMRLNLAINNNSDKEVAGIKGAFVYFDKFGDQIIRLDFSNDALNIPAGGFADGTVEWDYNQFMDSHIQFMQTDLNDMKYEFQADTILFADGTTL